GHRLDQLLRPDGDRDAASQEFVRSLPRKAQKAVEKLQGQSFLGSRSGWAGWYASLALAADRAGLLARDDVGAARPVLFRASGAEIPAGLADGGAGSLLGIEGGLALGQVAGLAELVRFFLSDGYHELRAGLGGEGART